MLINTYLHFNGQCADAFKFYEQCLGGKTAFTMTYGESPMAGMVPENWRGKVMHTRLTVGDQVLMGADACPDRFEKPQGFSVTINLKEAAAAERIFAALAAGGMVGMPIQETFWAVRFGMLTDKFGIPWMINCEKTPA